VVGGSSAEYAGSGTPATNATYLLDFSVRPLIWRREDMTTGRVMPNTLLLPDGAPLLGTPDVYQPQCLPALTICRKINLLAVTAKDIRRCNPARLYCVEVYHECVNLGTGSVAIVNGGNVGIAGGGLFAGQSINTDPRNQQAEIYSTFLPFGTRMSGLLASSGRDRWDLHYSSPPKPCPFLSCVHSLAVDSGQASVCHADSSMC